VPEWNINPGGRPGKKPAKSAACARGKHTLCFKENCTCGDCGHPAPVKKSTKREIVIDRILESLAI